MKQIRIHGRGGQGVVTASELVAMAAFFSGHEAQAFPSFGVERTGAPIEAFVRIDDKEIRTREQIYSPDYIIILDASLLGSTDIMYGSYRNTKVIINTTKTKEEIDIDIPAKNIYLINATEIALKILGRNIVNTIMLGAIAKNTNLLTIAGAKKAVEEKFKEKGKDIINKNIKAVKLIYEN